MVEIDRGKFILEIFLGDFKGNSNDCIETLKISRFAFQYLSGRAELKSSSGTRAFIEKLAGKITQYCKDTNKDPNEYVSLKNSI